MQTTSFAITFDELTQKPLFFRMTGEDLPLGPRDVRVQVKAISINPVDTKVAGRLNAANKGPRVLGWDASGTVLEVGRDVKSLQVGVDVFYAGAVNRPGANTDRHIVDERLVGLKPKNLTHQQAAAMPLTSITAYESIFVKAKLHREDRQTVLVIGGAGGVGSVAIQILKALTKSKVIATAGRPESVAWVKQMGADHVVSYKDDFSAQLKDLGLAGANLVLCFNNTNQHFANMAKVTRPFGAICAIVDTTEPVNLEILKEKSISFHWESMFTRSTFQTEDMQEQQNLLNEISKLIEADKIKSTMTTDLGIMSEQSLTEAHAQSKSGQTIGKMTLRGIE